MTVTFSTQGRVTSVYKAHVTVFADGKTYDASMRGNFHTKPKNEWPKVGDWVSFTVIGDEVAVIDSVLPRKNTIARRVSFDDTMQVMVTNVDYLCIVMGLDNDFNPRRLKRYLALAETSEVSPLIVLTKSDISTDLETTKSEISTLAPNIPLHMVSSVTGEGTEELFEYLKPGITMVLLGSSGAGKSSLTNVLLGEEVEDVGEVRIRDDRGKHTTTRRQLYMLLNTAAIIDTPGLRELAMEDEEASAEAAYPDIAALTRNCRFSNCDHKNSAGCALQEAIENSSVSAADVAAFLKLKNKEVRHRRTRSKRLP